MEDNKNIDKEDTHKESHKKHFDTPIILIFGCALVLIAFVIGWQSSKMSTYKANVTADSSANYTNDYEDSSADSTADTVASYMYTDNELDNSSSDNQVNDFVGEYQLTSSDTMDYYRLFINQDHTARIIKKYYDLIFYYRKDGKVKHVNVSHSYGFGWWSMHHITSKREYKNKYKEIWNFSQDYEPPAIKIELTQCDTYDRIAYSWEEYVDDNLGPYIKLKSSTSGLFENEKFLYKNRLYNSYNAMQAKDEFHSTRLTRIR